MTAPAARAAAIEATRAAVTAARMKRTTATKENQA